MLYKTSFLCFLCVSILNAENIPLKTSNIQEQNVCSTKSQDVNINTDVQPESDSDIIEIKKVLVELNKKYAHYESSRPKQGYRVVFEEGQRLRFRLIPMGTSRTTEKLSGIPKNEKFYRTNYCPFCTSHPKIFVAYDDQCRAIISQRGQILLIPDEHSNHWFEIPLEGQLKLLKHALELRKDHPDKIQSPLELHCGSAAFQTVFHTHLRTGIILNSQ